jgi:hypothetical protein
MTKEQRVALRQINRILGAGDILLSNRAVAEIFRLVQSHSLEEAVNMKRLICVIITRSSLKTVEESWHFFPAKHYDDIFQFFCRMTNRREGLIPLLAQKCKDGIPKNLKSFYFDDFIQHENATLEEISAVLDFYPDRLLKPSRLYSTGHDQTAIERAFSCTSNRTLLNYIRERTIASLDAREGGRGNFTEFWRDAYGGEFTVDCAEVLVEFLRDLPSVERLHVNFKPTTDCWTDSAIVLLEGLAKYGQKLDTLLLFFPTEKYEVMSDMKKQELRSKIGKALASMTQLKTLRLSIDWMYPDDPSENLRENPFRDGLDITDGIVSLLSHNQLENLNLWGFVVNKESMFKALKSNQSVDRISDCTCFNGTANLEGFVATLASGNTSIYHVPIHKVMETYVLGKDKDLLLNKARKTNNLGTFSSELQARCNLFHRLNYYVELNRAGRREVRNPRISRKAFLEVIRKHVGVSQALRGGDNCHDDSSNHDDSNGDRTDHDSSSDGAYDSGFYLEDYTDRFWSDDDSTDGDIVDVDNGRYFYGRSDWWERFDRCNKDPRLKVKPPSDFQLLYGLLREKPGVWSGWATENTPAAEAASLPDRKRKAEGASLDN